MPSSVFRSGVKNNARVKLNRRDPMEAECIEFFVSFSYDAAEEVFLLLRDLLDGAQRSSSGGSWHG